jgi:hypothetical protein
MFSQLKDFLNIASEGERASGKMKDKPFRLVALHYLSLKIRLKAGEFKPDPEPGTCRRLTPGYRHNGQDPGIPFHPEPRILNIKPQLSWRAGDKDGAFEDHLISGSAAAAAEELIAG